jgi:hypothetical protein
MKKLLWLLLLPIQLFATNYYVSNSGSDAAAGTIAAPWASIAKVNSSMGILVAGDSVLFQRGGEFFGALTISKAGVIIGAYGSGNLPIITGFKTLAGWASAGTNLWSAGTASPKSYLNVVTINGIMVRKGRYPDYADNAGGWLTYSNSLAASSPVNVSSTSSIPTSFVGGELVLRKNNYNLDVMPITGQSGNTFTCSNPAGLYGIAGGSGNFGFFVQSHIATLTTANEWHFNSSTKAVTIYSTVSPTAVIKASIFDTVVNVTASSVTIENLDIQGSNRFGVISSGGSFVLKNSYVRFIGYWGIQINGSSTTILNNLIRDIGSNGIWMANSGTIQGNQVKAISNLDGMGGNQDDQGIGIALQTSAGVTCRNNIVDSISYNGIKFNGSNVNIRENVVSNVCINKNDGGGIYTWERNGQDNFTNKQVKRNVIVNNGKVLYGMPGEYATAFYPLYMDGGTANVTIDSNVVALSRNSQNSKWDAIGTYDDAAVLFNNPRNISFTNSIIFGFPVAFQMSDWSPSIPVTPKPSNNTITGNCFYVNAMANGSNWKETNKAFYWQSQGSVSVAQQQTDVRNIGIMNNNFYSDSVQSPFYVSSYSVAGLPFPAKLSNWRTFSTKDTNSIRISASTPEFQYNATATPTTYTFTGRQKRDFRGTVYNNSATIPAYYGNIFFDNGPAGSNPPTVSCSASAIACNGGSSTVTVSGSGGTPPLTGTGTFSRTAGTYTFIVTDAAGQTGSCNVTITQPTLLVASNTAGTITTVGGSANIVVTASGGTAPYSGTGTFSRTAGTYTFTVTDANGCTATTTRTLTNPSPVVVTCSSTQINCNGGTSTITVSASGGTGPYNNTGNFIRSAGAYTFSVTDAVGATGTCSLTVTQPSELVASATAGTISTLGGTTSVVVTATGGTGAYTGTGTFTRGAGIHTFTVTDANGCSSFVIVSLNDPVIVAPQSIRINNIRFSNGN